MSPWLWLELTALALAVSSVPSVLLERQARPWSATLWLVVLITLPFVGVVAWWVIGRTSLERRRRRKRRARADVVSRLAVLHSTLASRDALPIVEECAPESARDQARRTIFTESDRVFAGPGTSTVELLPGAAEFYAALEAEIRGAKHHIHFEFYIYQPDEVGARFRDLLAERARAGVEVRILVDGVGGAGAAGRFLEPVKAAGGYVGVFLPVRFFARRLTINFRNHRKLVVVDGRAAFLGGINIGAEYLTWLDVGIKLVGPVVVQCQEVFAEDWYFAQAYALAKREYYDTYDVDAHAAPARPSVHTVRVRVLASGPDRTSNAHFQAFFLACTTAARRIWITTPYFIPDQAMSVALSSAAERGVDVRILVPAYSDVPFVQSASRSYYESLLETGVRVFEYTGGILHMKSLIFDDDWCLLGSANVDVRSFRLNFEAGAFIEGAAFNAELAGIFQRDQARAMEVSLADVRARPLGVRLQQAVAHLFSPLL